MTTTWARFINEQKNKEVKSKRKAQQLSTWIDTEQVASKPQIETDTNISVPGAVSRIVANQPTQDISTIQTATPEQELAVQKDIASVTKKQNTPIQNILTAANEISLGIDTLYTTAWTQSLEEARQKWEEIYQTKIEQAKTAVEADKETSARWLLSTALWDGSAKVDPKWTTKGLKATNIFPTGWLDTPGDNIYMTNGTTTISKPVIKSLDYNSVMADAYRSVVWLYQRDWKIPSIEEFRQYYPEYDRISDGTVQEFINECVYDAQQWIQTDINKFADYFGAMSMTEKYTNKQDATLEAITNDDVIDYSIWRYISGELTLPGRTPEEIMEYIQAAYTIQSFVDEINNQGYNLNGTAGYTLATMYANQFPELKEALDTYDKFDIKVDELQKINNSYEESIRNAKEMLSERQSMSAAEYRKTIDEYTQAYLNNFNAEFMNSWRKEALTNERWLTPWAIIDAVSLTGIGVRSLSQESGIESAWQMLDNFLYGNTYEADWKYYDLHWNEIQRDDIKVWVVNKYLESLQWLSNSITELNYDTEIAKIAWEWDLDNKRERTFDVAFDSVNTAFGLMMNLTKGWIMFQTSTELPVVWWLIEWLFDVTLEWLSRAARWIGDMIWFTDWWSEESKQKYEQAISWLGLMVLGRVKNKLVKAGKEKVARYMDNSALIRSVRKRAKAVVAWLKIIDEQAVKDAIIKEQGRERTLEDKTKTTEQVRPENEKTVERVKEEAKKTTTKTKIQFLKNVFKSATQEFNNTFEEELKRVMKETGTEPNIIDNLYSMAVKLATWRRPLESKVVEEAPAWARDVSEAQPAIWQIETAPEWTAELPDLTAKTATERTKQPGVFEIQEAPAGRIIESTATPAVESPKAEWKAKVEQTAETKTTVRKILDVVQSIMDTAKKVTEKIEEVNKERAERRKEHKSEEQALKDKELFQEADKDLSNEIIREVQNNPFSNIILDIVDLMTGTEKKKGKITKVEFEKWFTPDEIQRQILSQGIESIQEFIDYIISQKKELGWLYDKLSTEKTIDTTSFWNSKELKEILKNTDLEIWYEIAKDWSIKYKVTTKDGSDFDINEQEIAEYLEYQLNSNIWDRMISEKDAWKVRSKIQAKREWKWNFPQAMRRQLYDAWNKYLERQWGSELLRKIDKWYEALSDNAQLIKDLLSKDNTVKDNAKNTILKWDETTINEMDAIFPWIKDLISLAKAWPKIVNAVKDAKLQTKNTRAALGTWIRYAWVMIASTVGGWLGFILGSLWFTTIERRANNLKKKVAKYRPDLELYNRYVDNLNISDGLKSKTKQAMLDAFEVARQEFRWKSEAEIDEIIQEAIQIQIDRKANKILKDKAAKEKKAQQKAQKNAEQFVQQQTTLSNRPKLPEDTEWGVVATDRFPTAETVWVKETYKDKTSTQEQWYDKKAQAEDTLVQASIWWEWKEPSEAAIKLADAIQKIEESQQEATEEHAANNLEERGEDITEENLQKEMNRDTEEQDDIMSFINQIDKTEPGERPLDWKSASDKTLDATMDENYNVKPEYKQREEEILAEKARREHKKVRYQQADVERNQDIAWATRTLDKEKEHKKNEKEEEKYVRRTNKDPDVLETDDEFRNLQTSTSRADEDFANEVARWKKWVTRKDEKEDNRIREALGMKKQQDISYTSDADKISQHPSAKRRLTAARDRLDKKKNLSEEEVEKLNTIIEQAWQELATLEEMKELAKQYKANKEKQKDPRTTTEEKKKLAEENNKIEQEIKKFTEQDIEDAELETAILNETDKETAIAKEEQQYMKDLEEWLAQTEKTVNTLKEKKEKEWLSRSEEDRLQVQSEILEWLKELRNNYSKIIEKTQVVSSENKPESTQKSKNEQEYIADKFNERYELNESTGFRNKVTSLIQEIKDARKQWDRPTVREKMQQLDSMIWEKTGEWFTEIELFENQFRKERKENRASELENEIEELEQEKANNKKIDWFWNEAEWDEVFDEIALDQRKQEYQKITNTKKEDLPWIKNKELKYNKSTDENVYELEVYKWKRWYDIVDTPGDAWSVFYTDDPVRANQYAKNNDAEKTTLRLDKKDVKIVNSRWLKRNQAVDSEWNILKWQTSKKGESNYIDYNYRLAKSEWYKAIILRWITDIWPFSHKWSKMAASADDIILIDGWKSSTPKWENPLLKVTKSWELDQSEPTVTDFPIETVKTRIDYLANKRSEKWKLYAQEWTELKTLQDLYKRQVEYEAREEWESDLTDRQREILNSNDYGTTYSAWWLWVSED